MSESKNYDGNIGDKANSSFSRSLQNIIPSGKDVRELAEYLGCSIQAINQYKQGTAFPKTENLIKIADFFDVSVDYLLGRSSVRSRDENKQISQRTTGLSEESIDVLIHANHSNEEWPPEPTAEIIDTLLRSKYLHDLIAAYNKYQSAIMVDASRDKRACNNPIVADFIIPDDVMPQLDKCGLAIESAEWLKRAYLTEMSDVFKAIFKEEDR